MLERRDFIFSDAPFLLADLTDIFHELKKDNRRYYINVEAKYNHSLPSDERKKDHLLK
jgi:hypothetical protein